jgi:uncharacterized protein (TIGR02996 family)
MTDEQALFAAIRAHPEEDTPRLAYADWLDEQGGKGPPPLRPDRPAKVNPGSPAERAEDIRVSCELKRLHEAEDRAPETDARIKELRARSRKLREAVVKAWEAPFRNGKPIAGRYGGFHFDRGLPEWIILYGEQVLTYGEALLRLTPMVQLNAHNLDDDQFARLLATPWVREYPHLRLTLHQAELTRLADTTPLPALTDLWVDGTWTLSPDGADRLARSPNFPRLEKLRLFDPGTIQAGVTRLFDGPAVSTVRDLTLANPLPRGDLSLVLRSPWLTGLEKLMVRQGFTTPDADALVQSMFWPTLRNLIASGPALITAMESAPPCRLESLSLTYSGLGDLDAAVLARCPIWTTLRTLVLSGNRDLTAAGLSQLLQAMPPGSLRELNLHNCRVGDDGAKLLAAAPQLGELRKLHLGNNGVGDEGSAALARSPHLGRLTDLRLNRFAPDWELDPKVRRALMKRFGKSLSF